MPLAGTPRKVILEAMAVAARGLVCVEAVGVAAFQRRSAIRAGRLVVMRLGAMGGLGMRGPVGGCARLNVIFNAQRLDAPTQGLLLAQGSIALGLDLSLALAVGGFGLLEDAENVLALWRR